MTTRAPRRGRRTDRPARLSAPADFLSHGYRLPLAAALVYALAGFAWIAISDTLLRDLSPSIGAFHALQTSKGWLFVGVTALLLYLILLAAHHRIREGQARTEENLRRLDLALLAARGGVWDRGLGDGRLFLSPHLRKLLGLPEAEPVRACFWRELVHPDDRARIRRAVLTMLRRPDRVHQATCRLRHREGRWLDVLIAGRRVDDVAGRPGRLLGVVIDRTVLHRAVAQVEHLVNHDALTGLPNRHMLEKLLARTIGELREQGGRLMVARLDLAGFNEINSELGARVGDAALVELGRRLSGHAGADGAAARLGGDEFALMLRFTPDATGGLEEAALALGRLAAAPVTALGHTVRLDTDIGIAVFPSDGAGAGEIMDHAAMALAAARKEGLRQVRFYAPGMNAAVRRRASLLRDLRGAIGSGAIVAHFQPVVRLADRKLAGFEALARWTHAELGAIPPATFIPIAEEAGLIAAVGGLILRHACREAAAWNASGHGPLVVAVNLSPLELTAPDLGRDIADVLAATGLDPRCLEIEVTESALTGDVAAAARNLGRLRALGVAVAIDDFGTGFSSFRLLHSLPVSRLKIDRGFVEGYGVDPDSTAIVDSTLDLAARLGLSTTAEGVEEEAQAAGLQKRGCDLAQGWLFGKPLSAGEVAAMLPGAGTPD